MNDERTALRIRLLQLGGSISACWDKSTVGSFDQERAERAVDEATDAILAAGYRKPQQVTTVEELDAAVYAAFEEGQHLVLSDLHARPWIIWSDEDGDEQVNSWPQEEDPDRLALGDITLPATVIHVGARA